ncbi:hypothetical protein E8F20_02540 [Pseudomonas sp. BN415]|uniref:hypothetical protein n=1 Tax=Pseudomonas sp. BN415 TaxID=2567889 RepID=UPI00245379BE|nr:hypothetical protein [Pseudomonas sp. BN415]MDH4580749.1 hypothetical protein [Pseudomonas sp. BN415]
MNTSDWKTCQLDISDLDFEGDNLRERWADLHSGNHEPWPEDQQLQNAWRLYHYGRFAEAVDAALGLGDAGVVVASFAATMQAQYVEQDPTRRAELFKQVMAWSYEALCRGNVSANLHYMYAVALGRYSQLISVMEALAQGYASVIKTQVEKALELDPQHAEALATFAGWHASVSEQAGELMAKMLYGASQEAAEELYQKALHSAPQSVIPLIEMAWGLETMFGKSSNEDALQCLDKALSLPTLDAMQRLDQQRARTQQARLNALTQDQ